MIQRRKRRKLILENLEMRRVLASSMGWDGPGTGSAELTYYVGNAPSYLSQSAVEAAIETALGVWSEVIVVEFTPTSRSGQRDSLDFTFRNLDGPGGTIAQAYFPDDVNPARIAGDVQFDSSERWEIGNAQGSRAFDLVLVAVHEIGHSLGLNHTDEHGSIMKPSISPNVEFVTLSAHDVHAIEKLYAPANPPSEDPPTPERPVSPTRPTFPIQPSTPDRPTTPNNPFAGFNFPRRTESPTLPLSPFNSFQWTYNFGNYPNNSLRFRGFANAGVPGDSGSMPWISSNVNKGGSSTILVISSHSVATDIYGMTHRFNNTVGSSVSTLVVNRHYLGATNEPSQTKGTTDNTRENQISDELFTGLEREFRFSGGYAAHRVAAP